MNCGLRIATQERFFINFREVMNSLVRLISICAAVKEGWIIYSKKITEIFKRHNESQFDQEKVLKANLAKVQNKIDTIEEKYYINGEMPRDTYDKLSSKLFEQKKEILETLRNLNEGESNLKKCFHALMTVSPKLSAG
jgi:hypothetical protein